MNMKEVISYLRAATGTVEMDRPEYLRKMDRLLTYAERLENQEEEIPNGDRPASEMTKREMIAAMIAAGLAALPGSVPISWAVRTADELLKELKKKETK